MMLIEFVWLRVLEISIVASMAGIVILGAKRLLKKKIAPKALNLLWVVLFFILINPFSIESSWSIYNLPVIKNLDICNWLEKETLDSHTNSKVSFFWLKKWKTDVESLTGITTENEEENNGKTESFPEKQDELEVVGEVAKEFWKQVPAIIYFVGLFSSILWRMRIKMKIEREANEEWKEERVEKILEEVRQQLCLKNKIQLVKQKQRGSPAIYGMRKPKILLPETILDFSDEEIRCILLHELLHLKRGDLFVNCFLQQLQTIYWFQPWILYLLKRVKADVEMENDADVFQYMKKENIYLKTLIKTAAFSSKKIANSLGIASNVKELEERIKMIKGREKFLKNSLVTFGMMAVLILGITVCFATTQFHQEENLDENQIVLEENEMDFIPLKVVNPLEGSLKVTETYGERIHPITSQKKFHDGVDLAAERGQKVMAIMDGVVEQTGYQMAEGNQVKIKHEINGEVLYTYYNHLSQIEVEVGDVVEAGDKIGEVGSTGMATGPHLHLKITKENGETQNPGDYLEW